MKNVNLLKAILFVVVFTSFTATTFSVPAKVKTPVKDEPITITAFDMWLSNSPDFLMVNYTNPGNLTLQIKVSDIFGNILEIRTVNNPQGIELFSLATLEANGGTGTYTVEMTSGDGSSSKKGTIVIIKE